MIGGRVGEFCAFNISNSGLQMINMRPDGGMGPGPPPNRGGQKACNAPQTGGANWGLWPPQNIGVGGHERCNGPPTWGGQNASWPPQVQKNFAPFGRDGLAPPT